jgi:hypothetical protein
MSIFIHQSRVQGPDHEFGGVLGKQDMGEEATTTLPRIRYCYRWRLLVCSITGIGKECPIFTLSTTRKTGRVD